MLDLRFFLEKADSYLQAAKTAEQNGDISTAKFNYLKSAECLLKAAKKSPAALKEQRLNNAEKLKAYAEHINIQYSTRNNQCSSKPHFQVRATGNKQQITDNGSMVSEFEPRTTDNGQRTTFSSIAGLEAVKEIIRLRLIYPFLHPELAEEYGKRKGGGILLYGPPGTGKTLLARAVAGEVDAAFFPIKPSEIMSKWVGESEQNIKNLFDSAREHERAVIFIDEIEALIPRRKSGQSTVMMRVVPQILAELEGFEKHKGCLLFLGATNEPWALDSAVMRPGRFDEKILVPLPDLPAREQILRMNLEGLPIDENFDFNLLAEQLEGYSGADIRNVCQKASDIPYKEALTNGTKRMINFNDFGIVLKETKPSVNLKMVEKYLNF